MSNNPFVPPAAEGLPLAALDSATEGADRLNVWALSPSGRNFLAHALVQLARDGWLRPEAGEGFEPVRERDDVPEPQEPAVLLAVPVPPVPDPDLRALVDAYLTATHKARHDVLGVGGTCYGCALRDWMRRMADGNGTADVLPPTTHATVGGSGRAAEAELYVLLRKAGEDRYEAQALIDRHRDEVLHRAELRRMAAEAQQPAECSPACSEQHTYCPGCALAADEARQQPDTETPTEEQIVRDHVTSLHLIGEQLADIENWMWRHLADVRDASGPGRVADEEPAETRTSCTCSHPDDEHSIYGCADGCGCEWMPKRKPMDPVHILGLYADDEPAAVSQPGKET